MNINLDSVFSLLMNPALHEFQARALQNPDESLSKMLLPTIALIEGLIANEPTYLHTKRRAFGANFCCAGQVAIGDFATLETALTSPQARDWRLGTAVLDANHSPNQDVGGRNVFLLSLSDLAAGGNGDRTAAFQDMLSKVDNDCLIIAKNLCSKKSRTQAHISSLPDPPYPAFTREGQEYSQSPPFLRGI